MLGSLIVATLPLAARMRWRLLSLAQSAAMKGVEDEEGCPGMGWPFVVAMVDQVSHPRTVEALHKRTPYSIVVIHTIKIGGAVEDWAICNRDGEFGDV